MALDLSDTAHLGEVRRAGFTNADSLANILSEKKELANNWKHNTCGRYLSVASKLNAKGAQIPAKWEVVFRRAALVDAPRAHVTAGIAGRHWAAAASVWQSVGSHLGRPIHYVRIWNLFRVPLFRGRRRQMNDAPASRSRSVFDRPTTLAQIGPSFFHEKSFPYTAAGKYLINWFQ